MEELNGFTDLDKAKQNQMLKLVTNSFYKELVNYGIETADIVKVSVNLLDHVTSHKKNSDSNNGFYSTIYHVSDVVNNWHPGREIISNGTTIKPLTEKQIPQVCTWLQSPDIDQTFISFFPKEERALKVYCLNRTDRSYFGIYYEQEHFVGIIGAENINHNFKKLEMKKFIGSSKLRGKGIGKMATFLFLYYTFNILDFNKVYIHSLDTNIKNVNLNSKFGFDLEGILFKEAYLNNKYRDVLRMGLLKSTWEDIFQQQE